MGAVSEFLEQLRSVRSAWMPFVVTQATATFVVWKIFQWRYSAQIARLQDDVSWAQKQLERDERRVSIPRISEKIRSSTEQENKAVESVKNHGMERLLVPKGVTLKRLIDLRDSVGGIHGDRQMGSFTGKWIEFDEEVLETGLDGDRCFVRSLVGGEHDQLRDTLRHQVSFWFESVSPLLEMLQKGDMIRGRGQIQSIDILGSIVIHCELRSE